MKRTDHTRRRFLGAIGGGLLFSIGGTGVGTADAVGTAVSWSGQSSDSRERTIGRVGPAGALTEAWSGEMHAYRNGVDVGPVVGETVYAAGDTLAAFDIESGTEKWRFEGGPPPEPDPDASHSYIQSPTVADGAVYAPVHYSVYDAYDHIQTALVALDAATGGKRWRIEFPVKADLSAVTVADGLCYVDGPDIDGGDGTYIYCLEPEDGAVRWRTEAPRGEHGTARAPRVTDGLVITDGVAYDARTGKRSHTIDRSEPAGGHPINWNGRYFVTQQSGIHAYDSESGEPLWKALGQVADLRIGAVADDTLYVYEDTEPGITVIALDPATGEQQWKQAMAKNGNVTEMITDENRVYFEVSSEQSAAVIIALDRTDGTELWRTSVDRTRDQQSPERVPRGIFTRIGSLLYAGAAIIDPASGELKQTFAIDHGIMTTYRVEAIANGKLFLGGADLIVVEGERTERSTPQPTTTRTATASDETSVKPADETADATDGRSATTAESSSDSPEETPTGDETTATNGPGFGILASIAGLGLAGWRYRRL